MAEQDQTPQHSQGFGPAENSDDTRQAQHQAANDTPVDINPNAILARAQAETIAQLGKNHEAASNRLNNIFNDIAAWRAGKLT